MIDWSDGVASGGALIGGAGYASLCATHDRLDGRPSGGRLAGLALAKRYLNRTIRLAQIWARSPGTAASGDGLH